jgi:hypothetical protein
MDSLAMRALADLVAFGEPNDGAVPAAACHPSRVVAARAPESTHYTAGVNHFDLTCLHGDGVWGGADRRPCMWYTAMAHKAARQSPRGGDGVGDTYVI